MADSEPREGQKCLGLRCAWCGKVLRQPVGYPDSKTPLAWTHGICPDCQNRFQQDPTSSQAEPTLVLRTE
jgi:hypothetical protein